MDWKGALGRMSLWNELSNRDLGDLQEFRLGLVSGAGSRQRQQYGRGLKASRRLTLKEGRDFQNEGKELAGKILPEL